MRLACRARPGSTPSVFFWPPWCAPVPSSPYQPQGGTGGRLFGARRQWRRCCCCTSAAPNRARDRCGEPDHDGRYAAAAAAGGAGRRPPPQCTCCSASRPRPRDRAAATIGHQRRRRAGGGAPAMPRGTPLGLESVTADGEVELGLSGACASDNTGYDLSRDLFIGSAKARWACSSPRHARALPATWHGEHRSADHGSQAGSTTLRGCRPSRMKAPGVRRSPA